MTCPVCGNQNTAVAKTIKASSVFRVRNCTCGTEWSTVESIREGSVKEMRAAPRIPIPRETIEFVKARDGNACRYCGVSGVPLGIDHVLPVVAPMPVGMTHLEVAEARNLPENLVTCCPKCNSAKSDIVGGVRMSPKAVSRRALAIPNSQMATPVSPNGARGVGGDLPLSLFPVSPSGLSQQSGSGRAIRRGRPDTAEYTPEFLALWALAKAQGKAGNKAPAFKAWLRLNADAELNALIATRFEEWMKTDSWRRGFNFHFVTWLNQRGWEEPPTEADLKGPAAASTPARDIRGADYCVWHQRHQNDRTVSRYPKGGCPGCKAVTMAEAERSHAAEVAKIMAERARKTQ